MKAYEVAERDVKGKYEDAYLMNIAAGKFPISSGDLAAWVEGGLYSRWKFTYFSPSQNLEIRVTVEGNKTKITTSTGDEKNAEELSASEQAVEHPPRRDTANSIDTQSAITQVTNGILSEQRRR